MCKDGEQSTKMQQLFSFYFKCAWVIITSKSITDGKTKHTIIDLS